MKFSKVMNFFPSFCEMCASFCSYSSQLLGSPLLSFILQVMVRNPWKHSTVPVYCFFLNASLSVLARYFVSGASCWSYSHSARIEFASSLATCALTVFCCFSTDMVLSHIMKMMRMIIMRNVLMMSGIGRSMARLFIVSVECLFYNYWHSFSFFCVIVC